MSLYWFTVTFGSSSWFMYDGTEFNWPEGNPGGRPFAAMEQPDHVAADMRLFFAKVR